MFINVLIAIGGFIVGSFLCSWGVVGLGCVLFTSYPLIKRLEKYGLIDAKAARRRNCFTICLWIAIDAGAVFALRAAANWNSWLSWGAAVGAGIILLLSLGKMSPRTEANRMDFVGSYSRFFAPGGEEAAAMMMMKYPQEISVDEAKILVEAAKQ